ncbi:MAG: TlpA family protein disulfide reductase [Acidimicrobiia bacterium]|nr:TlpA family protein disulfide reductase [Acidimicrobiia bacterium]
MTETETETGTEPTASPSHGVGSTRTVSLAVGAVLALLIGVLGWQVLVADDAGIRSEIIGRAAPAVVGTDLDGEPVDIDRWRGSWVVVNFFATWCVPCRVEHPELVEFAERHDDGSVHMVSVAFDDRADEIRQFFDERGGDWPVLATDTGGIALDYGVRGVPESFLVSPAGQIVGIFYGVTAEALDDAIEMFERSDGEELPGVADDGVEPITRDEADAVAPASTGDDR